MQILGDYVDTRSKFVSKRREKANFCMKLYSIIKVDLGITFKYISDFATTQYTCSGFSFRYNRGYMRGR